MRILATMLAAAICAAVSQAATTEKSVSKTADEFANEIASVVENRLKTHSLPFLDDDQIRAIRDEFQRIVAKHTPKNATAKWQSSIQGAVELYLAERFSADSFRRNDAQRDFSDRIKTLQWQLYLSLTRESLNDSQQQKLEQQRDWILFYIDSLPVRRSSRGQVLYSRDEAVEWFDRVLSDPLMPVLKEPMSDEQFARFQKELQNKDRATQLSFVVHHVVLHGLWAIYPDYDAFQLPTDDAVISFGATSGWIRLGFRSSHQKD